MNRFGRYRLERQLSGEIRTRKRKSAFPRRTYYLHYVELVVDQIRRRILGGEKIPHAEKVFSIHKPHTRWISKGKAGVLPELGLPVAL